jgi:hypothetical protein
MNIEFMTNDYLLAWYLLFKPSFSEEMQRLKVKLYQNYGQQYMRLEKENIEILKYNDDFIPDDDTIYNIIFESEIFKKIKKETDRHRQFLMKIWDSNQKKVKSILKEIVRFNIKDIYRIIVIHPELESVEYIQTNPKKNIAWGKSNDKDDNIKTLMRMVYTIIKYEIGKFQKENREIVSSIIDLTITNELQTRLTGISKFNEGFKNLKLLKKQLYPYFLMYLGADREELVGYMMRDQMPFDIDKYPIEKELRNVDLFGFIDFCCKNQKYIIRLNSLDMS